MPYNPSYIPTGWNNRQNDYYKPGNHVKIPRNWSTKRYFTPYGSPVYKPINGQIPDLGLDFGVFPFPEDWEFTRVGKASYVDKDGIIIWATDNEPRMPHHVFEADGDPVPVLGPELTVNGDFSQGETGWTLGDGWSIGDGVATCDTSDGTSSMSMHSAALVVGRSYILEADVEVISGAGVKLEGDGGSVLVALDATGHTSESFVATSTSVVFRRIGLTVTTLDNISVREITDYTYPGKWVNYGLLLESEARTNMLLQSEDLTTVWTGGGLDRTPQDDGLLVTVTLGAPTPAQLYQVTSTSAIGTQTDTWEFKWTDHDWVSIATYEGLTRTENYFNVATGEAGTLGAGATMHVETRDNGWFRVSVSVDRATAAGYSAFAVVAGDGDDSPPIVGASVLVRRPQAEEGATPSSYIATGDAPETRGAETLVIPAASLPIDKGDDLIRNGDFEDIGPELITNGDFNEVGSELIVDGGFDEDPYGPELITNGDFNETGVNHTINGSFDADTDWTKTAAWSISGGEAHNDGSQGDQPKLTQALSVPEGKNVLVQYTVTASANNGGWIRAVVNSNANGTSNYDVGTYSEVIKAGSGTAQFYMQCHSAFIGSIDDISCAEVGPGWTFGDGWGLRDDGSGTNNIATCDGTNDAYSTLRHAQDMEAGKTYEITWTIVDISAAAFRIKVGSVYGPEYSTAGTYTDVITGDGTGFSVIATVGAVGTIDNVSVRELTSDWTLGDGWSISGGQAHCDGTQGAQTHIEQGTSSALVYEYNYTVAAIAAGTLRPKIAGNAGTYVSDVGSYSEILKSTGVGTLGITGSSSFDGSVDNISAKQIGQGWTYDDGWTLEADGSGGYVAVFDSDTAGYIIADPNFTVDDASYEITFTLTGVSRGAFTPTIGGTVGTGRTADGTYTEVLTANFGNAFNIYAGQSTTGKVTNISVREVAAGWTLGDGWAWSSDGTMVCDGSQASATLLTQAPDPLDSGKTYEVTFDLSEFSGGSITVVLGSALSQAYFTNGTHKVVLASNGESFSLRGDGNFIGKVDNIVVKEVSMPVTLGPELITNGDFDEVGPELLTNGTFDTGIDDWTFYDGGGSGELSWDASERSLRISNNDIYSHAWQDFPIPTALCYVSCRYKMNAGAGTGQVQVGNAGGNNGSLVAGALSNQTDWADFGQSFTGSGGIKSISLKASNLISDMSFDDVSIKQIGQGWTFGDGWSLEADPAGGYVAVCDGSQSAGSHQVNDMPVVAGRTYQLSMDVIEVSAGNTRLSIGGVSGGWSSDVGMYTATITAVSTGAMYITGDVSFIGKVDNVSVREYTEAVSIGMNGTVTYADTDNSVEVQPYRWGGLNWTEQIRSLINTAGNRIGTVFFYQSVKSVTSSVFSADDTYTPGVNVPYNIAAAHTSNRVNGAHEGNVLVENTDPTALSDLTAEDMDLGYTYMGTIKNFRMWGTDIQDQGLYEATGGTGDMPAQAQLFGPFNNSTVKYWLRATPIPDKVDIFWEAGFDLDSDTDPDLFVPADKLNEQPGLSPQLIADIHAKIAELT